MKWVYIVTKSFVSDVEEFEHHEETILVSESYENAKAGCNNYMSTFGNQGPFEWKKCGPRVWKHKENRSLGWGYNYFIYKRLLNDRWWMK